MTKKLSVVTIARNEEANIEECLKSTSGWANEHIVVDGFSVDATVKLASRYTDKIFQRQMDTEGVHRNWAYQKAKNEWVLSLDADEAVTEELKKEISKVITSKVEFNAYSIPLKTYVGDYWVRHGGWYPANKLRLFKKSKFRYEEVGVHPRVILDGKCGRLKKDIIHKGYAGFSDLFQGLEAQTTLEAQKWFDEKRKINAAGMLRKACDRFLRTYIRKQGFRDGMVGFIIALNSGLYQIFSYAKYWEAMRKGKK